jgi:protein phosphatase 1 regulatory subunit 42
MQPAEDTSSMVLASGLRFEPSSLQAISGSLCVLCAANCGIRDPAPLAALQKLHTLDLSGNSIDRLALLQPVLQRLQRLRVLDVRGNPCLQHELKYRDYIILVAADSLEMLDNEAVPTSHRAFLLGLHLKKLKAQGRAEQQQQGEKQQQRGRKPQGQLQHQHEGAEPLFGQCVAGKPAAAAAAVSGGACVGLSGTGVKLHAVRAPAVRPTAAGGFNASGARIAAVLGGTRGRGGSNPFAHERV